jgi:hypothetical protein
MNKRLKSRIDRLETASATGVLSNVAVEMLASVYGRLHALFLPSRSHPHSWGEVKRLRREYIAGTTGISARSPGAKDWTVGHDARRELVAAKLAVAVRAGVETTGLILTPQGRATALAMVLPVIPAVPVAEAFTEALASLPADRVRGGESWVSESALFAIDCTGDTSRWQCFTDIMIEPCVSGSVDSLCDIQGRAFYRFVKPFGPLPITEGIDVDDRAVDAYVSAFTGELPRLRKLESTDGEIVIPLSVTT